MTQLDAIIYYKAYRVSRISCSPPREAKRINLFFPQQPPPPPPLPPWNLGELHPPDDRDGELQNGNGHTAGDACNETGSFLPYMKLTLVNTPPGKLLLTHETPPKDSTPIQNLQNETSVLSFSHV